MDKTGLPKIPTQQIMPQSPSSVPKGFKPEPTTPESIGKLSIDEPKLKDDSDATIREDTSNMHLLRETVNRNNARQLGIIPLVMGKGNEQRKDTVSLGSLPSSSEDRIYTSPKKNLNVLPDPDDGLMADMPMLTGEQDDLTPRTGRLNFQPEMNQRGKGVPYEIFERSNYGQSLKSGGPRQMNMLGQGQEHKRMSSLNAWQINNEHR